LTASKALSNTQIARAALVVLFGFLASGVLGVIRSAIIAGIFGAGAAPDAFARAQQIPELVFVLVAGGALGSSFIPVFARIRETDDAQAWRLASAVMTLSAAAAAVLSLVIIVFAPWIVATILAPGVPPEYQALTVNLTRLMMVTPVIFSISGLIMGILHTYQQFFLPSIAISMNNIGLMVGALLFAGMLAPDPGVGQVGDANIYGLALGAILSAVLHLAVQLPGLWHVRARLRPLFDWRAPGVLEVLRLMGPRVLGLAVVRVNFIVNAAFTSVMIYGSATVLTNAFTLMFFALGIIAQSVGQAVFPTLSALAAEGDMDGFKGRLAAAIRSVLFLSFPATVALVLLGEPLVRVMFERGEWTAENTAGAAWALAFYALGIAGFSLLEVLSRAFYALADTWTPVMVGLAAMISNIALSVLLIQVIGEPGSLARGPFAGLALANAATTIVEALALWWLLRRRIGDLRDRAILNSAGRAALAALGMGAALWALLNLSGDSGSWGMLVIGGVLGGGVFFGLSLLLGVAEARTVPRLLLRRVRR
jgi:putative peptidoglycan lipid II flippase